jgi:hypothetical protein
MSTVYGVKAPSYTAVLELDKMIRDFPVPARLQSKCDQPDAHDESDTVTHMQRWTLISSKEISKYSPCVRDVDAYGMYSVAESTSTLSRKCFVCGAARPLEASIQPIGHCYLSGVLETHRRPHCHPQACPLGYRAH